MTRSISKKSDTLLRPVKKGSASPIVGYSIIQAASMDAAKKMLENHPHFHTEGGSIELFEFLPMPGM